MNNLNLFDDTQRVKNMKRGYWRINSNRSKLKRFTKYSANEDLFNKYVSIDNIKIIDVLGKEPSLLQSREEARQV